MYIILYCAAYRSQSSHLSLPLHLALTTFRLAFIPGPGVHYNCGCPGLSAQALQHGVKGGCANAALSPLVLHREILVSPPCTAPHQEAEGLPDLDPA